MWSTRVGTPAGRVAELTCQLKSRMMMVLAGTASWLPGRGQMRSSQWQAHEGGRLCMPGEVGKGRERSASGPRSATAKRLARTVPGACRLRMAIEDLWEYMTGCLGPAHSPLCACKKPACGCTSGGMHGLVYLAGRPERRPKSAARSLQDGTWGCVAHGRGPAWEFTTG